MSESEIVVVNETTLTNEQNFEPRASTRKRRAAVKFNAGEKGETLLRRKKPEKTSQTKRLKIVPNEQLKESNKSEKLKKEKIVPNEQLKESNKKSNKSEKLKKEKPKITPYDKPNNSQNIPNTTSNLTDLLDAKNLQDTLNKFQLPRQVKQCIEDIVALENNPKIDIQNDNHFVLIPKNPGGIETTMRNITPQSLILVQDLIQANNEGIEILGEQSLPKKTFVDFSAENSIIDCQNVGEVDFINFAIQNHLIESESHFESVDELKTSFDSSIRQNTNESFWKEFQLDMIRICELEQNKIFMQVVCSSLKINPLFGAFVFLSLSWISFYKIFCRKNFVKIEVFHKIVSEQLSRFNEYNLEKEKRNIFVEIIHNKTISCKTYPTFKFEVMLDFLLLQFGFEIANGYNTFHKLNETEYQTLRNKIDKENLRIFDIYAPIFRP